MPFTIDTSHHEQPLQIEVWPLSRESYKPLLSEIEKNELKSLDCIEIEKVKEMRSAKYCKETCIPILLSSLFNTSEISICQSFQEHFCALMDIWNYIVNKRKTCMKQEEEKNFIGMTTFRTGFYNFYPEIIN